MFLMKRTTLGSPGPLAGTGGGCFQDPGVQGIQHRVPEGVSWVGVREW